MIKLMQYFVVIGVAILLCGCLYEGWYEMAITEYGATIRIRADRLDPECLQDVHAEQFAQADAIIINTIKTSHYYGTVIEPAWFEQRIKTIKHFYFTIAYSEQFPSCVGFWAGAYQAYGGYCETIVGLYAHELATMLLWYEYPELMEPRYVTAGTLLYDIETDISRLYNSRSCN